MRNPSPGTASTFIVLLAFAVANLPATLGVFWLTPGMQAVELVAWFMLAMGAWMAFKHRGPQLTRTVLAKTWSLIPFVAFSGLSILWSVAWGVSLARWLVLLSTIVVGALVGLTFDDRALLRNLGIFLAMILLLSTLLVYMAPTLGVMNYHAIQGAWRGVYWHKNHMGLIAGFACIVFLMLTIAAWKAPGRARWVWGLLYLLAIAFASQTDSAASYVTMIVMHALIAVLLGHLWLKDRLRPVHYLILGIIALLGLIALFSNLELVFGLFNRKTNLTGRVPMWEHLFDVYLSQRPWGGYGFNAFWHTESHRTTLQALAHYPDQIVIADNGFIDILMNGGVVGLLLFFLFYLVLWLRVARRAWHATDVLGLLPLIVMAYVLLANVTWSLIFENEGFFMLLMMALMFSVPDYVSGRDARQRNSASPGPDAPSEPLRA